MTAIDDTGIVLYHYLQALSVKVSRNTVLRMLNTPAGNTPSESLYIWKNIGHSLLKYKAVIAIFLILFLGLFTAFRQEYLQTLIGYLGVLSLGILVSAAILYKEQFNDSFLESFCNIGKVVDCNEVLHSKGASIAGVGLGELSLFYFATLFFFCTLCPADFYGIAALCCAAALCFTLYSVIYQIFILHKGCMLCMLVNITIWISAAILYGSSHHSEFYISLSALSALAAIGYIGLIARVSIKALYKDQKEKIVLQHRITALLNPEVFQSLLPLEAHIERPIAVNIALLNQGGENNRSTACSKELTKVHPTNA